jgi:hypothetical protein
MNDSATPSPQEREAVLFALAIEKPVAERAAFLEAVCGKDLDLRQRLVALLAAHDEPGGWDKDTADESAVKATVKSEAVASGFHLWSETYDRNLTNIFAIQDDIARTVVAKLKLALAEPTGLPTVQRHTANVEAYELYLKGNGEKLTEPELRQAITHLQEALTRQPDYALAYTGLAGAYGTSPAPAPTIPSG